MRPVERNGAVSAPIAKKLWPRFTTLSLFFTLLSTRFEFAFIHTSPKKYPIIKYKILKMIRFLVNPRITKIGMVIKYAIRIIWFFLNFLFNNIDVKSPMITPIVKKLL